MSQIVYGSFHTPSPGGAKFNVQASSWGLPGCPQVAVTTPEPHSTCVLHLNVEGARNLMLALGRFVAAHTPVRDDVWGSE